MCEALDEIIEFHVQKRIKEREEKVEAKVKARVEARLQEGRREILLSLVRDGLLSLEEAAKRAELTTEKMQELLVNG